MKSLSAFLDAKTRAFRRGAIRFETRDYQVDTARKAARALRAGSNVVVDLPTGAGKTNVAFITALQWHFARRGKPKFIYVVPTRILVHQVVTAATWLNPEIKRVAITPKLTANYFRLNAAVQSSDILVTTPGLLASQLRTGQLDKKPLLSAVPFLVVDEFDEFLTVDATARGWSVRFEQDFQELRDQMPQLPLLLMSGTAPKAAAQVVHSYIANQLSEFVDSSLAPHRIAVPESSYKRYIPIAHVRLVGVVDPWVERLDAALRYSIYSRIRDFECSSGVVLNTEYLMERLAQIQSGLIKFVLERDRSKVRVDRELRELARQLLVIVNKFTFLHEDMFAGIKAEDVKVPKIVHCMQTDEFIEVPILRDSRDSNEFWPDLKFKAIELLSLVRERRDKRGVVFTRNVRLSDALERMFKYASVPTVTLDGRLSEHARLGRVEAFKRFDTGGVLIITRTTGKRGLDLPDADYAIIYSPKEDEYTVWQELSRIRSTLGKGKESMILFYVDTSEERRLRNLEEDMRSSANRYRFLGARKNDIVAEVGAWREARSSS